MDVRRGLGRLQKCLINCYRAAQLNLNLVYDGGIPIIIFLKSDIKRQK